MLLQQERKYSISAVMGGARQRGFAANFEPSLSGLPRSSSRGAQAADACNDDANDKVDVWSFKYA